ncbi:LuxR C-terminal-related transcriptional regulator [Actinomycetospora endophytica]|uniref:LuxR C-terminal-related transcriptional regulator n=1 Tax=Actinomycetospora endophytica TaxID=2291215 RepID=A0ABS8P607_9PSEU|nr:LuxR family transcriptional regulator [Actinomycetospora endophytica]MCD2193694.1 LuxR C-terminal-related transcriptional regulator [Actinomycetospora endophytica]
MAAPEDDRTTRPSGADVRPAALVDGAVGAHDRSEIRRALLDVLEQGRGTVLITGEPGVGKSQLLREALIRARGTPVLTAAGVEWEQDCSYGVLAQLVGDEVGGLAGDDAFTAADRLVARAGDQPVVIVVDDAHWCDVDSVRALSTMVRHHRRTPVVMLFVATPGLGASAPVALLRRTADLALPLGPLSNRELEELCSSRGRPLPPWLLERLRRHTNGNPRHVLALLAEQPDAMWDTPDLRLPAPEDVAVRVDEECEALTEQAGRLVEVVACFAEPVSLDEIARTAGIRDVLAPLSEAAERGLVTRFGGRSLPVVGPASPMVRAAILDRVGPHRAAELRRVAAEIVSEPQRHLGLLAAATPGPAPELASRLTDLAAAKTADGAWSDAAHALLEASRLSERRETRELLLIRAVDALIGAGAVFEAEAMIPAVENLFDSDIRNSVLAYLAIQLGRRTQAERTLTRAWDLVDPDADPDAAAWICQRRVLHALLCGDGPALVTWADRATDLVGPDHPAAVEALAMRGLGTAASGRPAEALSEYRALAARVREGPQVQRITMGHGWLHLVVGDLDEARAELESAIPTTTLGGSSRISLWASGWLARAHFLAGDWDLALRTVAHGLRRAEQTGIAIVTPLLGWTAAQIHSLRGEEDRAERVLRDANTGVEDYEIMAVPRRLARAALAEARSDYRAVVRALGPLATRDDDSTVAQPGWWPWRDVYVNALVLEGQLDDAEAFLDHHEARAAEQDNRPELARLAWARGRLHAARGDLDAARDAFEASLAALDTMSLPWDRARAHFAYGQSLRRLAQRRDADTILSTARELFLALGATSYVARCDRELRAGGVHQTRHERATRELTSQEAAVVELVVQGRSNKDVASELQISPKTVQYHLTRIYGKYGVRSRTELARRHPDERGDVT